MAKITCLNCTNDAFYSVNNPGAAVQAFCEKHLPPVYNKRALPEFITMIDSTPAPSLVNEAVAAEAAKIATEAVAKSSKKKAVAEPVAEPTPEPVVETVAEPVVEEPVVE